MSVGPPDNDRSITALLGLGDRTTDRIRKLLTAYVILGTGLKTAKVWYDKVQREATFTVAVRGDDAIYPDVHRWVIDNLPSKRRRALAVKSRKLNGDAPVCAGTDEPHTGLRLFYDGSRVQTVEMDGHAIKVAVESRAGDKLEMMDPDRAPSFLAAMERVVFTARSIEGREAVLRFLHGLVEEQAMRTPRFFLAGRYGRWTRRSELPTRPLETVVLRKGQREMLLGDLADFLAAESAYHRLGIPWHRGLLFAGPPGCGKTSAAKALAGHLRLDVYFIPLSAVESDSRLIELFAGIEPRSMLVLEDIDIVHGARDRTDNEPGVTLAGLLNTLDGFATPHGLITVMTSNNADVLDPALVRPGRIDRIERMGPLDDDQLRELGRVFLDRELLGPVRAEVAPAEVLEVCKRHLDDPDAAALAIEALVR